MARRVVSALVPFLIALAAAQAATGADPYADRFERARELERRGRHAEAAAELEPLVDAYPDDYALFLKLGWLHFEAGEAAAAMPRYRRAAEISGESQEARLGLAWSLLLLGDSDEAQRIFRELLAESPELVSAQKGLAAIRRSRRVRVSAGGAYVDYARDPYRRSAWAASVGLDAPIGNSLMVAGTFRYARFSNLGGPNLGGQNAGLVDYDQQELYLTSGVRRRRWGVFGHFAYVNAEAEFADHLFAVGASGRISRLGDLWLEASGTFYPDRAFVRVSPWWRLELGRGFYATPGGALQVVEGNRVIGNGFLELGFAGTRGALWVGGKGGPERRPTYFQVPLVLNVIDEVDWGVWAGGSLRLGDHVDLRAGYQLNGLETPLAAGSQTSLMHVMSAGLGVSF